MISLADVEAARERITGSIVRTPCLRSHRLSQQSGADVFVKYENHQLTGAYKERGALNKLLLLSADEKRRGVIAASAGNHAQGVACHASRTGVKAVIVMPETTPLVKVQSTRGFGARVVLHGRSYDDAYQEALRLQEAEGLVFIHPFDDAAVIAGQGTLGLELLEQVPELEAIILPIGGGGLISGVATAVKALRPEVKIFGVQAARAPSMVKSLEAGEPIVVGGSRTLAEGIQVKRPGELTFGIVRRLVDQVRTVSENELADAIIFLLEKEKSLAEGAGAAGVAALLAGRFPDLASRRIATVLCGGNIDLPMLSLIIERSLVRSGRMVRFSMKLPNQPGELARLLDVIAAAEANVVEIEHHRTFTNAPFWEALVILTLETRDSRHAEELAASLDEHGYRVRDAFAVDG